MKNILKKLFSLLALLLILGSAPLWGAGLSNLGTDFWLAIPQAEDVFAPLYLQLYINSIPGATGQVQIPGVAFTSAFTVPAGGTAIVSLPLSCMATGSDAVASLGIHVTSTNPVAVMGLGCGGASTDAYLGLPTTLLGENYMVLTYADQGYGYPSEFTIVGAFNGTTVTITPSQTTGARTGGVPYNITLNQGDVYQLQDSGAAGADLSGSSVVSTQPVGVWGANVLASIPLNVLEEDYIVEQLWPIPMWGTQYLVIPMPEATGNDFRYLASQNGTQVSVNGTVVATLNQGQFFEQQMAVPAQITSNNPIYVMQYSDGIDYSGTGTGTTGDPSMMSIPPVNEYGTQYLVSQGINNANYPTGFPVNGENVIAPTSAVGTFTLDGVPIPAGLFTPIGASGYSGAAVTVTVATHSVAGPVPFGLQAYGFQLADAYSFPGGLVVGAPTNTPTVTPTPMPSSTPTLTPSNTPTYSPTLTPTPTPTFTPLNTPTPTWTFTVTSTFTPTCVPHVWPDPFNPAWAVNGTLNLSCLPPGAVVSFYTLSGEWVGDQTESGGEVQWKGFNQRGAPVAPGIYYYAVKAGNQAVNEGKFLVVR